MANAILTPTAVTRECLSVLHQKLNFVGNIVRDYDKNYAKTGAKIGDTLKIRLPNEYVIRRGRTLATQDTNETSVELKVNNQLGVDLNFTSADLTMSLDDFSDRIIEPAMNVLAANIESDALLYLYKKVYQQIDNQGQPASFKKTLEARKKLVDSLGAGVFNMLLNTQDNVDLVDSLKGLFNDSKEVGKQYRDGKIGRTGGFDFWENTLMPTHTRGAGAGYLINGGAQVGSTIVVDTGTGAIKAGDVFTIAGVFRVHPETKLSTGILQQFVATADATSGATSLSISPAIVTSGGRQNVSAAPADNAAITFAGTASTTHGLSLAFQKEAFAFGTADLIMPSGVDFASRQVLDGISMRIVRQYDINNDQFPCRLDVLMGYEAIRPQLAARVANN